MKCSFLKMRILQKGLAAVTTLIMMEKFNFMKPTQFVWTRRAEEVFEVHSVNEIQNMTWS